MHDRVPKRKHNPLTTKGAVACTLKAVVKTGTTPTALASTLQELPPSVSQSGSRALPLTCPSATAAPHRVIGVMKQECPPSLTA